METWIACIRKFNQTSDSMGRVSARSKKASTMKASSAPVVPLFTCLMDSIPQRQVNTNNSIFEAKGGLRPALMNCNTQATFDKIVGMPVVKRAVRHITTALSSGVQACVQTMDGGTSALKKLEEAVVAATIAEIRTESALPKASWVVKVFEMEVIGTNSGYVTASWSPYGMMSAIMVLEGNVAFVGVPTNKVEGASYADKRATIFRSTIDDLNQYLLPSVGGFYVRFEGAGGPNGESVIVVPSGFLIAYAASNVRFLRWALVADQADAARVKVALKNILQSFSEYNAPDLAYRPLAENVGINLNT